LLQVRERLREPALRGLDLGLAEPHLLALTARVLE
jgi:hypothetical protein